MSDVLDTIVDLIEDNALLFAFALVGLVMLIGGWIGKTLTRGQVAGSAVAILLGLLLAYFGGLQEGGEKGLADVSLFSGLR